MPLRMEGRSGGSKRCLREFVEGRRNLQMGDCTIQKEWRKEIHTK